MFKMILEDYFDELSEEELIAVNGGACTSGGCTGVSYSSFSGGSSNSGFGSGTGTIILAAGTCTTDTTSQNSETDNLFQDSGDVNKVACASAPAGVAFPVGMEWSDKYVITSEYGEREVIKTAAGDTISNHYGLDISGSNIYGERINSMMEGTVTKVSYDRSFGNYVVVSHYNGTSTLYAHCSKIEVSEGFYVSAGQKIAEVGSTGKSTGPHLHIAYDGNGDGKYNDSKYDNPEKLLYACN